MGRAAGIKLYAYVGNTPLNRIDPVGRCDNLSGCAAGSSDQLNMADEPSIWPRHADITDHNRLNNGARRCSPLEVNWLTASSRKRRSRSGQCLPSSNASASMLNYSAHHADQDAKVWLGQPWAAAALLIELPQALVVARSQHYIAPMDTAPPPPPRQLSHNPRRHPGGDPAPDRPGGRNDRRGARVGCRRARRVVGRGRRLDR